MSVGHALLAPPRDRKLQAPTSHVYLKTWELGSRGSVWHIHVHMCNSQVIVGVKTMALLISKPTAQRETFKGIHKRCVPGSFLSAHTREPKAEAM